MISRFKLPVWIAAVSPDPVVCQGLQFSYGVYPCQEDTEGKDWNAFCRRWMQDQGLSEKGLAVLLQGPSPTHPNANPSLELITPA